MAGWERFRAASPGPAHRALAELEARGLANRVITQNVDRLHQAAGSRNVLELHGALPEVVCLACGQVEARGEVQARLRALNPSWIDGDAPLAPDGDAELPDDLVARFVVAPCLACGGPLKPRVVFFGENVERSVVDDAFASVDAARALLVAGTSLAVFSGYRFLRRAAERGIPIYIVNRGPVRGEERATVKVEAGTGVTLSAIVDRVRG
jgi:NAD-dependent SIR2 family protein deacetylase